MDTLKVLAWFVLTLLILTPWGMIFFLYVPQRRKMLTRIHKLESDLHQLREAVRSVVRGPEFRTLKQQIDHAVRAMNRYFS